MLRLGWGYIWRFRKQINNSKLLQEKKQKQINQEGKGGLLVEFRLNYISFCKVSINYGWNLTRNSLENILIEYKWKIQLWENSWISQINERIKEQLLIVLISRKWD